MSSVCREELYIDEKKKIVKKRIWIGKKAEKIDWTEYYEGKKQWKFIEDFEVNKEVEIQRLIYGKLCLLFFQ